MKISISLSKYQPNVYTGKSGLYSAVEPTKESIETVVELCKLAGFDNLVDDFHCTVMYSPENTIPESEAKSYSQDDYIADVKGFNWWEGHDKDGYLVLELDSSELDVEHQRFKKLGCKSTFPDYRPHITLKNKFWFKDDAERKSALANGNRIIKQNPLEITLINQKVEDIKSS